MVHGKSSTHAAGGGESVLHVFHGGSGDGAHPLGTLNLDKQGNLVGLTSHGGPGCGSAGCGVIFNIAPDGTETVLSDLGNKVGAYPENGLIRDRHGNLYGVTFNGRQGTTHGAVFRFHP